MNEINLESTMPLSGKLVKALLNNVCHKPIQGDDSWEQCSIGIATNSVVATDGNSAVIIGEPADLHVATQRKEALVEAERATIYGDPVRFDQVERNTDMATGEAKPMPSIQSVIERNMAGMKPLASLNPEALAGIAKIAMAAGAVSVDLFLPKDKDASMLGFEFRFVPESGHINLFSSWDGDIRARGVFMVQAPLAKAEEKEQEQLPEVKTAEKPVKAKKVKEEVVTSAPEGHELTRAVAKNLVSDRMAMLDRGGVLLPPLSVLQEQAPDTIDSGEYADKIMEVMRAYNIIARLSAVSPGPTVTMYELDVPAGTSVKKVAALADDLQMQLAVKSVRIQAPIPGKKAIGIEIPNKTPRVVALDEVVATQDFVGADARLLVALGLDLAGRPVYTDVAATPHLLIAGATNSGKSIGLACILSSLLLRNTPKDLRLILIDPKQVELSLFEEIPHLACPVVTNTLEVPGVLRAVVREMEHRYDLLKKEGVRNISGWNGKAHEDDRMPYVVVVIDELADLMMQCRAEVEPLIVRIAQKARAVGIHLIVATQRPSVDVVTGIIKANVPSRIAFSVASQIDSRVILDQNGAEKLLGRGDMLFAPIDGGGRLTRLQGAYVGEDEVAAICKYWRGLQGPTYDLLPAPAGEDEEDDGEETEDDALFAEAVAFVRERGQASTSMLEAAGFVGPRDGPRPREVLTAAAGVE